MRQRPSFSLNLIARINIVLVTILLLFTVVSPSIAKGLPQQNLRLNTPMEVGRLPEEFYEACRGNAKGLSTLIGLIPIAGDFAAFFADDWVANNCIAQSDPVSSGFASAYARAEALGFWPGIADGRVGKEYDLTIQYFERGDLGDGAILWGSGQPEPFYVGGDTWELYRQSIKENEIHPGYPTSDLHRWGEVWIQDFDVGSWGDGAILTSYGGGGLVAGRHWEAYWKNSGPSVLGAPTSWVYQNSEGKYQQDFERGAITELDHQTWVTPHEAPPAPSELPAVGHEEANQPPIQPIGPDTSSAQVDAPVAPAAAPASDGSAQCSDSGITQITNGLTVSPENPDTATQVELSFTITNYGCGTWAPKVLAIGGRDPNGDVSDPLQIRDFTLAPGESQDISQLAVLSIPGTHEFFMAYLWTNDHWNEIPDASGVSHHIYVNVTEAGSAQIGPTDVNSGEGPEDDGPSSSLSTHYEMYGFEAGCHYFWFDDETGWFANNCDIGVSPEALGSPLAEPVKDGCYYLFDGSYFYQNTDYGCG